MRLFLSVIPLIGAAIAQSRTTAPSGALVVGNGGKYKTISSAVNAAKAGSVIFVLPGKYNEQVYVPANKGALTIMGSTPDASSYEKNQVTISARNSQANKPNNDETGTLRVKNDGFKLYNINVENTWGKGSQALALSAYGKSQGFYGCGFFGFQDTVMPNDGSQYFSKCLITGATDFIFGQKSLAWFEKCDIGVRNGGKYITANGRDSNSNPSFYVINNSKVTAAKGESVPAGSYFLGRPWRSYSRVVFQNTELSNVINGAGWSVWQSSEPNTKNVYYGEYKNTGPGAEGRRASFSKKLSSAVPITQILGGTYKTWVDAAYL
ncbi:pectinesterase-like protein [Eremomyces bilateralis CBS 781.70]|uniref:Pectinesterase n=1 Tax=Eremomyces bilateralis CBS 781.70 TaxID=1392243 RepID=A0A6G1GFR6_9PEZI|nr:pectinesterase-like protein [Eremomyces bilateralis CBS 781.70]KAF1816945.1 pectinesterase-like protein [Eremomyces bilateralis CBS 781.70]